jgi:hypothetical protein
VAIDSIHTADSQSLAVSAAGDDRQVIRLFIADRLEPSRTFPATVRIQLQDRIVEHSFPAYTAHRTDTGAVDCVGNDSDSPTVQCLAEYTGIASTHTLQINGRNYEPSPDTGD